jgi:hypothetical protein
MADEVHFQFARERGLVILTKNPDDFAELHSSNPDHAGILTVYQDNDPDRDMTYGEIVKAIANVENAGVPIRGSIQTLNAWRY